MFGPLYDYQVFILDKIYSRVKNEDLTPKLFFIMSLSGGSNRDRLQRISSSPLSSFWIPSMDIGRL